jgi:hypothetical protein
MIAVMQWSLACFFALPLLFCFLQLFGKEFCLHPETYYLCAPKKSWRGKVGIITEADFFEIIF